MKTCRQCNNQFEIRDQDRALYERMQALEPEYCPDCRMMRRLAHRNERTLYKRDCDLCKQSGVSIYPPETPWPVYCQKCWWSDSWEAKEFGQDYDPSRPFFEQWIEVRNKVPRISLLVINSVNSEYTNNAEDNKNCYLIFAAGINEDCYYGRLVFKNKMIMDVAFGYDSELCYECVDIRGCYSCLYSERCQTSSDLLFCYDVRDSQNCILSTNLRHEQYMILNKKCTKEEYEAKKKEILSSYDNLQQAKKQFEELKAQTTVKYAFQTKCNNAVGDYLFNCHDSYRVFDASDAKECAYMADTEQPIDCIDCNNAYGGSELCAQNMGILQCNSCKYCTYIFYCNNIEYCDNVYNGQDMFGCIGFKNGKYMILNKEYSKEDYTKLREQIIADMKARGEYGQFLPPETSPHGYNETFAKDLFPMTKEEAIAKGFRWQDATTGTEGKETITTDAMPQNIDDVTDDILKEVLVCESCNRNFRLTKFELDFYRRMHLPLPRRDFECRHQDRMRQRTPRKLWHRQCMCELNHMQHEGSRCANEFETSYSPNRKEQVYCEPCYQQEVA